MELAHLIEALKEPAAYPYPVERVEVRQTHISAVFLAGRAPFTVVRSDVVRKELAGIPPAEPAPLPSREWLYSAAWTERTYAECLRRAERVLFEGGRVLVDATFREESRRRAFLDAAARWRVPGAVLLCRAEPETVRQRLEDRQSDASDADWSVYLGGRALGGGEPPHAAGSPGGLDGRDARAGRRPSRRGAAGVGPLGMSRQEAGEPSVPPW